MSGTIVSATAALYGQYASLSGFVRDASDAVVAWTAVEIRSVDTGLAYNTFSNESGVYSFGSLKPGTYDITTSAAGFQTEARHGVKLDVAQQADLDFVLRVGETREAVTVTGEAELIQTNDAMVSTVIAREFSENMPLNGRSFNTLVELTPGTVTVAINELSRGKYAINGQRSDANYYQGRRRGPEHWRRVEQGDRPGRAGSGVCISAGRDKGAGVLRVFTTRKVTRCAESRARMAGGGAGMHWKQHRSGRTLWNEGILFLDCLYH
ncbi:MAG: carboxypeptidase-like regulatory domain-containing protein [Candidatus Solibacter sp.]